MKPVFTITGKVINGQKRGKQLGFPTANISLNSNIADGIYAAEVVIDNKVYKAASFVGKAITYNETELKLESYILDFNEDIYEKEIEVKLYKKIRENIKFESEAELISQMTKDIIKVKEFFS